MTPDQERKLLEDVAETRRLIEALNDGATAYLPPERRNIGTWAAEVRQSLANTEGAVARVEANPGANVQELAEALAPLLQQETGAVTSGDLAAAVDGLLAQLPPAVLQLLKSKL